MIAVLVAVVTLIDTIIDLAHRRWPDGSGANSETPNVPQG
jgi:hypothetical protein